MFLMVFPIVQSYKFKSKSQQNRCRSPEHQGVPDSSKLQIQKQITTKRILKPTIETVFPIVQSYKFKSKSQRLFKILDYGMGVPDSSKLQIQKQITTVWERQAMMGRVFPIVQSYKFKSKSQPRSASRLPPPWCSR